MNNYIRQPVAAENGGISRESTAVNSISSTNAFQHEVEQGDRFRFGANWARFLSELDEKRIIQAESSLRKLFGVSDLKGKRFADVGSGSGLFSLAARRLGAQVHSLDYDPTSVACAEELRRRFFPHDEMWSIDQASALDTAYLASLGTFDIVYSWGVLHHTGAMWNGLANVVPLVKPGGLLCVSIYNDQGKTSDRWRSVKKLYNRLPPALRFLVLVPATVRLWGPSVVRDLVHGHPLRTWSQYHEQRGMSAWRDVVDWVGGYPFEVARPEEILSFYCARGFELTGIQTCGGGIGCNEFVFRRAKD